MNDPREEHLMTKIRAGDTDALLEFVEQKKTYIYDYVLHMTGDMRRASHSVDDVANALVSAPSVPSTDPLALKLHLFETARELNAAVWLQVGGSRKNTSGHGWEDTDFERALRSLPAAEREALLLTRRFGFSPVEAQTIMRVGAAQVQALTKSAEGMLKTVLGKDLDIEHLLGRLDSESGEALSEYSTVALSKLISGVQKVKPRLSAQIWFRFSVVALIVMLGLVLFKVIY